MLLGRPPELTVCSRILHSRSAAAHTAVTTCTAGLTVAEYFRDEEGQDVLLFIDNIFRFTQVPSLLRSMQTKCSTHH